MTRPTEKQLAEALLRECDAMISAVRAWNGGPKGTWAQSHDLEAAVRAYRSAQQAEAGAAGGEQSAADRVRELFDEWFTKFYQCLPDIDGDIVDLHHLGRWNTWRHAFERGRQQGMEQARGARAVYTAPPRGWDPLAGPAPAAAQPAASSAQEPGWVMVPVEPTEEMQYAGQQNFDGGSRWTRVGNIYRAMLSAAPARLAGAAQGEAVALLSEADMEDLRRLDGLFSDGEGWDLPTERMKRLAELGAIRRTGGNYYTITSLGMHCLDPQWSLPLKTASEWNDESRLRALSRITASTASDEGSV